MSDDPNTTPENPEATGTTPPEDGEERGPWGEFMERQNRAFDHAGKAFRALFPDKTVEHWNSALDEFGQGLRALVDGLSEKVSAAKGEGAKADAGSGDNDGGDRPSTTGKKKVKVEVD